MIFASKEHLCKRCNYARVYRNTGLTCNVTKNKPIYHIFCKHFKLNRFWDNKIVSNTVDDKFNQTIFLIIGLITLFLIIAYLNFFLSIFFLIVTIFVFSFYKNKSKDATIIRKITNVNYVFLLGSTYILTKIKKPNNNDYFIINQFLIIQLGKKLATDAELFLKNDLSKRKISLEEIYNNVNNKISNKEKIYISNALFGLAICDNLQITENNLFRKFAFTLGLSKSQYDFLKNKNINSEKKRCQFEKQEYKTINDTIKYDNLEKYYKIIGVSSTASFDEIKKAYRKLAHKYHPDKNSDNKDEHTKKFQEILEAYNIIKQNREVK